jgi:benzodiazapine receptor
MFGGVGIQGGKILAERQGRGILKLAFSIIVCELVGVLGSVFTAPAIGTWYAALNKPSFNPPNWIFGPVWISLYFIMGVSAYLIWRRGLKKPGVRISMFLFLVQLVLNAAWTPVFFGLRQPGAALAVIAAMWFAILATILSFRKASVTAAVLLIPYIAWVSFAAALNAAIVLLN